MKNKFNILDKTQQPKEQDNRMSIPSIVVLETVL